MSQVYIHTCTAGFYGDTVECLTATQEISVSPHWVPNVTGEEKYQTQISRVAVRHSTALP